MALKDETGDVQDVAAKPATGAAPESLADLEREATLLDVAPEREALAGQVAEAEAAVAGNQAELLMTLEAIRAMVFPMLAMVTDERRMAALGQVWNDGVLGQSAAAGAAVMEKHGWSMGSVMGNYGPYLMLAAALGPPIVMTKKILEKPKPEPKPEAPGGQQQ